MNLREPFKLEGGVAVITGAASGLGLEIARSCARAGMRLAICDIDVTSLDAAARELSAATQCVSLPVDVRSPGDLNRLADLAFNTFGTVDVVFNNAGVVIARPVLETTLDDWRWMLDVNLMGVIHGISAFLPQMLRQKTEGRIVNTASAAGFLSVMELAAYCVSKQGVVALSETLHQELQAQKANVGVTILCPAFVPTQITRSERNRPQQSSSQPLSEAAIAAEANLERAVRSGKLTATDVARKTLEGVRARALYVFTHKKIRRAIEERFADVYSAFADPAGHPVEKR
jgi:NAD(P)-dependent dehydrogenase (short-subunit alcohol dehydrogenase family)